LIFSWIVSYLFKSSEYTSQSFKYPFVYW